jgi:type 1 fimbria pilin
MIMIFSKINYGLRLSGLLMLLSTVNYAYAYSCGGTLSTNDEACEAQDLSVKVYVTGDTCAPVRSEWTHDIYFSNNITPSNKGAILDSKNSNFSFENCQVYNQIKVQWKGTADDDDSSLFKNDGTAGGGVAIKLVNTETKEQIQPNQQVAYNVVQGDAIITTNVLLVQEKENPNKGSVLSTITLNFEYD